MKYLPDEMLDEEQRQVKEKALPEERERLGDMQYEYAVESGDMDSAEQKLSCSTITNGQYSGKECGNCKCGSIYCGMHYLEYHYKRNEVRSESG